MKSYKTHKVKQWDDPLRTYCGLTEENFVNMVDQFVKRHETCTCKVCQRAYEKEALLHQFTELDHSVKDLKMEVFKMLRIPGFVEWINKQLK